MSVIQQNRKECGELMDKRAQKSKRDIQDAFFELLKDKPIENIRITEICDVADINRSTFYAHYEDLPCLVRSLKDEIISKMLAAHDKYAYDTDTKTMLTAFVSSIQENRNLFSLMYRYNELDIWESCKQKLNEIALPNWQKESGLPAEEVRLLLEYMYSGCFRLLQLLCEEEIGMDINRFQELFDGVVKYGIYNFIYTK